MSDGEEERTGSEPVAGVVCRIRAMRDGEEERAGSVPVAGAVSYGMQSTTKRKRELGVHAPAAGVVCQRSKMCDAEVWGAGSWRREMRDAGVE